MTVWTAQTLVRELAEQIGDYYLLTADGTGTVSVLSDANLVTWLPQDVANLNAWVYGTPTALGINNRTVERRASSWNSSQHTLAIAGAGFPDACSGGQYELHTRWRHSRLLAALNSGIHQLALSWYRSVVDDTSLTTVVNQWRYPLPASVNWTGINKVQIQISVDGTLVGYPYIDAAPWDYAVYKITDASGVTTWELQFSILPPPGRFIRIFGEAQPSDLVADADILPIDSDWATTALEWVYDWAQYRLFQWEGNRQPASLADKYKVWSLDRLNAAKEELLNNKPEHGNARLVVPGRGTGTFEGGPLGGDPSYLGAFRSIH